MNHGRTQRLAIFSVASKRENFRIRNFKLRESTLSLILWIFFFFLNSFHSHTSQPFFGDKDVDEYRAMNNINIFMEKYFINIFCLKSKHNVLYGNEYGYKIRWNGRNYEIQTEEIYHVSNTIQYSITIWYRFGKKKYYFPFLLPMRIEFHFYVDEIQIWVAICLSDQISQFAIVQELKLLFMLFHDFEK